MIWALALLPALAGLALWAAGGSRLWLGVLGVAALAVTLALVPFVGEARFAWAPGFPLMAELTSLSRLVAALVPLVAATAVAFAAAQEDEDGLPRLIGLMLVFAGAMELVVIAGDLVTLLIGWEAMGAVSWALIGHRWRASAPMGSANYAFVVTRAGDLGLFLALFACVTATGSAGYAALGEMEGGALTLAALGIVVAAAAKAGQVPFSPWLFRAMDGPTAVSALLHSSTMVAAGAFLLVRLHPWLGEAPGFAAAALGLGLVTALAGGLVATRQMHAKKVLAASTSAQLGLMVAAAGAGWPLVALLHLIAHALLKAPLFFAAGAAHHATGGFDLRAMRLGRALPWTAALTLLCAAALAGLPPLGAAWTKEEVLKTLAALSPWLAAAGIAAGGFSAAYATRFAVMAYGPGERTEAQRPPKAVPGAMLLLAAGTLLLSALWLPAVHEALPSTLPKGHALLLPASLTAVALGIGAGFWLARTPEEAAWAEWLGLPALIDAGVTRPALALARAAGQADDRWIDGLPKGAARGGVALSRGLGRSDDHWIDGMGAGGRGAVALAVRLGGGLSVAMGRAGETASDLLPTGTGRVTGLAGAGARRLQTGMAHHYYAGLAALTALGALVLILGA